VTVGILIPQSPSGLLKFPPRKLIKFIDAKMNKNKNNNKDNNNHKKLNKT